MIFVDRDGREIVVPNADDRAAILQMINSRARGKFAFDNDGKLYMEKKEGAEGYSEYYRDKLIAAIQDDQTITIVINQKVTVDGKEYDVDTDLGGGMVGKKGDNRTVVISGNGNNGLIDTEGKPLQYEPADVLAHELVGHAIPQIIGTDTGNAIDNENKLRAQLKEGENQLRASDPDHPEERK